jgi:NAD(P)-dependent dehydrogenase (short-subunit alcohol dehydrogenase family)
VIAGDWSRTAHHLKPRLVENLEELLIVATVKDVFSVEGKVTIVTGGGTGIGESIAKEFAARGAKVLVASRNVENLTRVRDEIRAAGGTCEMTTVDVRQADQCDAMIETAVKYFGRFDVLINNHGASITTPSFNLSPNGWRAVVGINLDGMFFCSKAAARQFVKQGPGDRSLICVNRRRAWFHNNASLWCFQSRRHQPDNLACGRVGRTRHPG